MPAVLKYFKDILFEMLSRFLIKFITSIIGIVKGVSVWLIYLYTGPDSGEDDRPSSPHVNFNGDVRREKYIYLTSFNM